MSSERELDEGIKSIKSAWRREHTARTNLKGMLEQAEAENVKLRDLIADMSRAFFTLDIDHCQACPRDKASRRCQMFATTDCECAFVTEMRKLGIEVE